MKEVGSSINEQLVEYGAVMLNNLLYEKSVERLQRRLPLNLELLIHSAPELEDAFGVFGLEAQDENLVCIHDEELGVSNLEDMVAHQDSQPAGLAFLIPRSGPRALFAASNQQFDGLHLPEMTTFYGPGDLIVVRQKLKTLNGQEVDMEPAWHLGSASENRHVVTVDWVAPVLQLQLERLPAATATTTASTSGEASTSEAT